MRRLELEPSVWHASRLVIDWDESTGEVSGPDAPYVLDLATWGRMPMHPHPWTYELGPEPTKSRADMAAMLGWRHHLPPDLAAAYPQPEQEPDAAVSDNEIPLVDLVH